MSKKTIADAKIGDIVSFTTKHPTDNNIYQGTITGIGMYDTAKNIADLVPYYQRVRTEIDLDPIEDLIYFVIQYTQDGKVTKSVFANDYVKDLEFVEIDKQYDIRIYDKCYEDVITAVELLKAKGYRCKILTK